MKEHIAYLEVDAECRSAEALTEVFEKIQREIWQNPGIYVLVLGGEGLPAAGGILGEAGERLVREGMENLRVPVLAASGTQIPENYLGSDIVIVSDDAQAEAQKLAEQIAGNAPIAVQQIKRCVNVGLRCGEDAGKEYELHAFSLCHSTQDKVIGMNALLKNESEKHFVNG